MKDKKINRKEIRFVGLQRSGNHAIINWILSQIAGKVLFLNFVKPNTNPFETAVQDRLIGFTDYCDCESESQQAARDCLLYSYEDDGLGEVFSEEFEKRHDAWVGTSEQRYDVLVIRDIFNFIACRLQWAINPERYSYTGKIPFTTWENIYKVVELWKMYAREYLGETSYLKNNKVVISYNRWFLDREYRSQIASALSIAFTDRGFNVCAVKSTFENLNEGEEGADKLQVLSRWRYFSDNDLYRKILRDKELVALSHMIFGEIAGELEE